jgi:hypothetical protein
VKLSKSSFTLFVYFIRALQSVYFFFEAEALVFYKAETVWLYFSSKRDEARVEPMPFVLGCYCLI